MEIGAVFILIVVAIAFAVIAFAVWAITSTLRRRQLHPEGDKLHPDADDSRAAGSDPQANGATRRPQHVRVRSEQRTRFLSHR
jgi:hypothetical protein